MPVMRDRVRLYQQVRTAHLERAAQLPPATIVYGEKRYDFHESLAGELDLVQARGWRAAWFLFKSPVSVLEVNEPLFLLGVRSTAMALVGLTLGQLAGAGRTRVVTYAIENVDPPSLAQPKTVKHRIARQFDLLLARRIWRRLDRIVFGTDAAQQVYSAALPQTGRVPRSVVIPALPMPMDDAAEGTKEPHRVLFVGAFVERKGFPFLLQAWPLVTAQLPSARLSLVGKGALRSLAEEAAAHDRSIEVCIDPPRTEIRRLQRLSQVCVLASRRYPGWREQVGLPIVEGLSYGCTIVSTNGTGLASWLTEHRHRVISDPGTPQELAEALLAALRSPVDPAEVLSSLPEQDGRLAADAWLFEDLASLNAPTAQVAPSVAARKRIRP